MLYQAYQAHCDLMEPLRVLAAMAARTGRPLIELGDLRCCAT
jgi:hypothetical protein